jgi:hypothetical protein
MPRKVGQDMIVKKPLQSGVVRVRQTSESVKTTTQSEPRVTSTATSHRSNQTQSRIQKSIPTQSLKLNNEKLSSEYSSPIAGLDDISRNIFHNSQQKSSVRGGSLWVVVGFAFVALVFTVFSLFRHATVHLELQKISYPIDITTTLSLEPDAAHIGFKTAHVKDRQTIIVPTTEKQVTNTVASGTVRLFSSQKTTTIPAGTTLVNSAQKKFITTSKIVVPAGTPTKPGSVDVVVNAATAGVDANSSLDDFTLPQFPSIVARSITEITGGNSGEQPVLSDAQLTDAKASLQTIMKNNHPATFLAHQVPEQYWIPESLVQVSDIQYYTEPVSSGVMVVAERTIIGNMIDRKSLNQFLVDTVIPESHRSYMQIVEGNTVTITRPQPIADNTETATTLPVHLSGSFIAQATIDETTLRQSIARQKKTAAMTLLRSLPGVTAATIHMRPPWIGQIPDQISKISFITSYQSVQ